MMAVRKQGLHGQDYPYREDWNDAMSIYDNLKKVESEKNKLNKNVKNKRKKESR